ncbi:protelomerase family protein (plasmid) [Microbulbifer sp. ANSA001]|uniref:protelomerase family protein n=1 Tax=Microbulbifer sp. ANSA001 TaxID=3243358 RepID=UPI0040415399
MSEKKEAAEKAVTEKERATRKVDLRKLVSKYKDEVVAIEASHAPQAEKTRKFRAIGQKIRSALYTDRRRYQGKGQANRVTLNTYNTYLSRVRKVFEEMGLRHHLLDRDIGRLQKRYPHHAQALESLENLPPEKTRLAKKHLEEQLRGAAKISSTLEGLDFSKPAAKRKIDQLRKAYPIYADMLSDLLSGDAIDAEFALLAALDEAELLIEGLTSLKINHEIMYALRMEKGLRATHTAKKEAALGVKKRTAIAIQYSNYIQRVTNILANPTKNSGADTMYAMAPLTFALCAATGRRPIEVLFQGEFSLVKLKGGKVDPHRLAFSGQAKKRSEDGEYQRIIYTLAPAEIVVAGIRHLRALPQVADLPESEGVKGDTRSLNAKIASRVGAPLNTYAKEFFADKKRVLKDTRSIYARICYELWFHRDPRWKKSDEDVFFAELLGHDDETTQMHYKQFKVAGCDPDFEPETEQRSGRLEQLAEFDEMMPDMANGDAAVKIHQKVKEQLEKDPETKFTQSFLINLTKAYRPLIKRYMETCADALGIELQENGRWRQLDEAEPPVLVEVPVEEEAEDLEAEEAEIEEQEAEDSVQEPSQRPAAKPRISYNREGNLWRAAVTIDGEEVAHSLDKNRQTAMEEAWTEYLAVTA